MGIKMHFIPFSAEQSRVLDDVMTVDRLHRSLLQREEGLGGGFQWKNVAGQDYLTRFWTDPTTKKKQARSRGRRSPATEAEYGDFYAARESVAAERRSLGPRMADVSRAARAFRLALVPQPVADVFRAFDRAGLWQACMLLGGCATHAHAVEARVRVEAELADIDLLVPEGLVSDVLPSIGGALRAARPDEAWHADGTAIVGSSGLRIHVHDASEVLEAFIATLPELDAIRAVSSALEGAPRAGFVVGRDGLAAPVATLDPTAHAVLKSAQAVSLGSKHARDAALVAVELARLIERSTALAPATTLAGLDFDNHDRIRPLGRARS